MRLLTSPPFPRRRTLPSLAALLLLFIAGLVLLTTAGPTQAQSTSVKLVGNTGKATSQTTGDSRDVAQIFSTGQHRYGYTLTEVQIDLAITGSTLPSYEVEIWTVDSSNQPNTKLGTLTKPTTLTTGLNSFTSASGIQLVTGGIYLVVIDLSSAGSSWAVRQTADNGEDPVEVFIPPGAIGDRIFWRTRSSTSTYSASNDALKMSVHGYENPTRKLVSNTGQASDAQVWSDIAQTFNTGPHPTGYTLTEVQLDVKITAGSLPSYEVEIWSANASNHPNVKQGTLTKPSTLATGLNSFTSASGIQLTKDTKYVVVIDRSSVNSVFQLQHTNSNGEDPGRASGWGILDNAFTRVPTSTGDYTSISQSLKMAVHGYENSLFSGATISERFVTVKFDHDRSRCPNLDAWTVKVNGVSHQPYSLRCDSRDVFLWLRDGSSGGPDPVRGRETVTLNYDKGKAGDRISIGGVEVESFSGFPVTNLWPVLSRTTPPTVNDRTLTLTFDQDLDASSVPAGSAFTVTTTYGSRPGLPGCAGGCNVAVTGVSLSGPTATLTLDETIPSHGTAFIVYSPPGTNNLQTGSGYPVDRVSALVTVLTPDTAPPVFTIAGLGHWHFDEGPVSYVRMYFDEVLDQDALPPSSAFRVTARTKDGRARTISGTGTVGESGTTGITVRLAELVGSSEIVTLSYVKPSANPLRDVAGNEVESFSGEPVDNGSPFVISTVVSSDPGNDRIYQQGEKFRVQVTFSYPVIVSGSPRLQIILGRTGPVVGAWRWAHYESGSGTPTLTFAYTVGQGDYSGEQGISVQARTLEPNGGYIASPWAPPWMPNPNYADLAGQTGTPFGRNHYVDARADETVWTATLDPKLFGNPNKNSGNDYYIGCNYYGHTACWQEGRLEPETAFTHAGVRNSFYDVYNHQGWHGGWGLVMVLERAAPRNWDLHVGDRVFCVESGDISSDGRTVRWDFSGDLGWVEGEDVTLKLTAPPSGAQWTCGGSGDHALPPAPLFESATVDGTALTLTFAGNLNRFSAPAPGAFHVTVNNARRNVASGGVAVSGDTVTLTLASAVEPGDRVKVRYTRPSANPLQGAAGRAVDTFADQEVPNDTPLWSATLTVRATGSPRGGCVDVFDESWECSSRLTHDSFTHAGTSYQVRWVLNALNEGGGPGRRLSFVLDKAIGSDWTLHADDHRFSVTDATLSGGDKRAEWIRSLSAWSNGQQVQLRLTIGGSSGGAGGNSAQTIPPTNPVTDPEPYTSSGPTVTGVEVTSDPGSDATYALGETIQVTLTFNDAVDVTGTPRLKIDMDPAEWGEKWASYASGSGTASLTFTHTVVEPNISTQGIAVLANTLELNGGDIELKDTDNDADLSHTGLAHDSNHKVDWQTAGEQSGGGGGVVGQGGNDDEQSEPASVSGVTVSSSPQANATYALGETIQVTLTFDEAVDVTGTPRLKIDMDPADWGEKWAAYQGGSGTASLTFTHTVVEPNISTQGIAVLENTLALNGGTIQSDDTDADLSHDGLAHDSDHKVDWEQSASESEPPANSAATGAPAITGTAQVGETLTADTSGIADADGLTGASFSYQWLADNSDISGATGSTYAPANADVGKAVKVRVSFTDDAGHAETLTSAATAAVAAASPPEVTAVAVTSSPSSGDTYGPGEVIRISVTFDEAVDVTGTPQLSIDMDPAEWGTKQAGYHSGSGTKALVFTHTVIEPNISTQGIAVLANTLALNGGDIESKATDTDADLSHTGLAHDANHKVNWRLGAPTVESVEVTSDPKNGDTYGPGEVIRISVTFDEAVDVTGAPQIAIDMDPAEWGTKQAAYESGSGTTTLVFAHTVVEPNISTQGIALLANTLALNGGDIESKATDTDANLSHTGLAHDAKHKVDWQQSDSGGPGS